MGHNVLRTSLVYIDPHA